MTAISITRLYDMLSTKLGKETAENLTTFIDNKINQGLESQSHILATKEDLAKLSLATKEDLSKIREDLAKLSTATKEDLAKFSLATKEDLAKFSLATKEDLAKLSLETKEDISKLAAATKEDISKLDAKIATLDTRISESKSETIKWMFLFWVGQMIGTFGFILLFLRK